MQRRSTVYVVRKTECTGSAAYFDILPSEKGGFCFAGR
nr:MAG TPA: hypothetical protein [Caudoviricetes sp.]